MHTNILKFLKKKIYIKSEYKLLKKKTYIKFLIKNYNIHIETLLIQHILIKIKNYKINGFTTYFFYPQLT